MAAMVDKPDLIIGIDFGMTYTGVAWTNLRTPTQVERRWPGKPDSGESKVPTKLVFSNNGGILSWGFECDEESLMPGQNSIQWFKIYLDQETLDKARTHGLDAPGSVHEAKQWITQYMRKIYDHISHAMVRDGQGWADKSIEFLFSVPTTWTSQAVVIDFTQAVRDAGFGSESRRHTVQIDLTEAEAAAVYTVKEKQVDFKDGDVILVCDAGGGTTDVALFRITDASEPPILKQLSQVQGFGIGSTVVDRKFKELVKKRLAAYPEVAGHLPPDLPKTLANSQKFRATKHGFGTTAGNFDSYHFKLDGVQHTFSHPGLEIDGGRMRFSRAEIQGLFDPVVEGIIRKIDGQLDIMRKIGENDQVRYLILSGGLGSSEYVRTRLMERYVYRRHSMAAGLTIVTCLEPQLAVAKGLIEDRRQKLERGRPVLTTRIARASYGVLCMREWNPMVHVNEDVIADEFYPNKKWAINQIDWLIKKGDAMATDSAPQRPFHRTLRPRDPTRKWRTTIIVSHNEPGFLPSSMKQGGAAKLCVLESNLSAVQEHEFVEKGRHCWSRKKHHFRADYVIKVVIAPADLRFELWFKGAPYTRDHNPIPVEWDKAGAAMKPKDEGDGLDVAGLRGF